MKVDEHKNVEKVIRYYLSFLPPRDVKSILDIGCGTSAPYGGILKNRCKKYLSLDIRPGPKVKIVTSVTNIPLKDKEIEWGWCSEMVEHLNVKNQLKAVKEIMRVCVNCIFTYPLPGFSSNDRLITVHSFYDDPGHVEVKIDWQKLFSDTHIITDKTTKTGRAIFILTKKGYKPPKTTKVTLF